MKGLSMLKPMLKPMGKPMGKPKGAAIVSALIFGVATLGTASAGERDMPSEIAPADSPAVRDTVEKGDDKSLKQMWRDRDDASTRSGQDNSRYSTDGTERYEDSSKDYSGTGPKQEGRY